MLRFFPFQITFRKKLKDQFNDISNEQIIEFFSKNFRNSGVKNIRRVTDNEIIADIMFFAFRWNWNRSTGVGQASVRITSNPGDLNRTVVYRYNQTRGIVLGLLIPVLFCVIIQLWWVGLFIYGVIGILIWIIKLLQHLTAFIDALTDMSSQSSKQDKTNE